MTAENIMVLPSSPKAERDKTVAAKDGGCGRSSQWWDSNEAVCGGRKICSLVLGGRGNIQAHSLTVRSTDMLWGIYGSDGE